MYGDRVDDTQYIAEREHVANARYRLSVLSNKVSPPIRGERQTDRTDAAFVRKPNIITSRRPEGLRQFVLQSRSITGIVQKLSYRKQIARQLRTQYVEGIYV